MTDKKFQELLDKVTKYHNLYSTHLEKAEKEYERRFGNNPSDVDDDLWIDSFHHNSKGASVEQVTDSAKMNSQLAEESR